MRRDLQRVGTGGRGAVISGGPLSRRAHGPHALTVWPWARRVNVVVETKSSRPPCPPFALSKRAGYRRIMFLNVFFHAMVSISDFSASLVRTTAPSSASVNRTTVFSSSVWSRSSVL
jgi:hypothetical protein